jgi:hypothetical protein
METLTVIVIVLPSLASMMNSKYGPNARDDSDLRTAIDRPLAVTTATVTTKTIALRPVTATAVTITVTIGTVIAVAVASLLHTEETSEKPLIGAHRPLIVPVPIPTFRRAADLQCLPGEVVVAVVNLPWDRERVDRTMILAATLRRCEVVTIATWTTLVAIGLCRVTAPDPLDAAETAPAAVAATATARKKNPPLKVIRVPVPVLAVDLALVATAANAHRAFLLVRLIPILQTTIPRRIPPPTVMASLQRDAPDTYKWKMLLPRISVLCL